jgi:transcription initiation factor TFIIE subunit alpha
MAKKKPAKKAKKPAKAPKKAKPAKAAKAPKPAKAPKAVKGRDDLTTEVVREVAGQDVLPLVKALRNKSNVSEFKLADAIRQEINLTRNMLYRLYDHNLVTFTRKKDKKKGWYIYYWTFNPKRVKELALNLKKNKVERMRERLSREQSTNFFMCANKCVRLDFDQATEFEYKCPECGEILQQEDNSKTIENLKIEIERLQKEINAKK